MNLGDKLGLFSRTVLVPAAKTIHASRDHTRYDARRTLRTVLYKCPAELPAAEFRLISTTVVGERHASRLYSVLIQLLFLSPALLLLFPRFRMGMSWVLAVCIVAVTLTLAARIIYYSRVPRIPPSTDADKVLMAWLRAGRCPACSFTLAPSNRCNECGAVWQQCQRKNDRG